MCSRRLHVTVAPLAAPVSSINASGALRETPVALFQCVLATTPALSAAAIVVALVPTKLTPIAGAGAAGVTGTIWIAFTGARFVLFDDVFGAAVSVKPPAVIVNLT